jgi:hypothetical protein
MRFASGGIDVKSVKLLPVTIFAVAFLYDRLFLKVLKHAKSCWGARFGALNFSFHE